MKIELWEGGGRKLKFRNERVVSITNSSTIQRSKVPLTNNAEQFDVHLVELPRIDRGNVLYRLCNACTDTTTVNLSILQFIVDFANLQLAIHFALRP